MILTRATALALAAWTIANKRAAEDYNTNPSRACHNGDCDQLRDNGEVYCPSHRRAADGANERMRLRRSRKAGAA